MKLQKCTKKLIVRPFCEEDYENLKDSISCLQPQKNVFEVLKRDPENKLTKRTFSAAVKRHREDCDNDLRYLFAVFQRSSGKLLGTVSFSDICRGVFQNACIGYHIFNQHWARGFATEAVETCIRLAFEELGFHRIEAVIYPENKKSIAVAVRLGFRYEGLSKKRIYENGEWRDMKIYAISVEDLGLKYDTLKSKEL